MPVVQGKETGRQGSLTGVAVHAGVVAGVTGGRVKAGDADPGGITDLAQSRPVGVLCQIGAGQAGIPVVSVMMQRRLGRLPIRMIQVVGTGSRKLVLPEILTLIGDGLP